VETIDTPMPRSIHLSEEYTSIMNNSVAAYQGFSVGDRVEYSPDKQSTHGARGTIVAIHKLSDGTVYADVQWEKPGLSRRMNIKNLTGL
jgi:hypothetical protein